MSGRDSTAADGRSDATPVADAPDRTSKLDAVDDPSACDGNPTSLAADGGEERERPLSERSRESIESEIDALEQNPERYETQDQAVIDRYEGLLAERQRRQRAIDSDNDRGTHDRLQRAKNRLLRTLGLR
jgi:hypothetical protein